ncbi:hypothetical protein [Neorickettsia findlayensis]|uniref:Uncharacterized protein n=1 Tax=Neorickettsia findlayensis TaxID=2686014 RepID=A0A6P1GB84_9RICK|nr:hypothetical protein [Neorickettsia findlayensis]QHD65424.1 hypothetical protein GP480_03230 [Neorickettsia findlayensis]
MRLPFLLFLVLAVSTGFAAANPIMEYFLTMSYVEGGMEPCASVVERLGDSNKRTQFLRVLASIQSVGKNSLNMDQIAQTLERAITYCNACPSSTFGMALVNAVRNSDSTKWCKDQSENRLYESTSNASTSTTSTILNSNVIKRKSDIQVHQYDGSNNSNNKKLRRSQTGSDRNDGVQIIE